MPRSASVDGFEVAYDRLGSGTPVVLLHDWPGSRHGYADVGARPQAETDLIVPGLRGFGDSDRYPRPPHATTTLAVLGGVRTHWLRHHEGSMSRRRACPTVWEP
jgi:pimeloyl-ACP methyl ester carboxylesterase